MPCYTAPEPPSREEILSAKMPAVLCALAAHLGEDEIIKIVDWREAGVTAIEFRDWWRLHQKRDQQRRAAEDEARRRAELKAAAVAKLTPEERAALGLK